MVPVAERDLRAEYPDWDGDYEELEKLVAEQEADDLHGQGKRDRIGREWVLYLGMPAHDGEWLVDPDAVESAMSRDQSGDHPNRIIRALAALNDDERELVHLYYYDQLSMRQCAERLNYRSVNSITKKLKRVHSKLEALLGQTPAAVQDAAAHERVRSLPRTASSQ